MNFPFARLDPVPAYKALITKLNLNMTMAVAEALSPDNQTNALCVVQPEMTRQFVMINCS